MFFEQTFKKIKFQFFFSKTSVENNLIGQKDFTGILLNWCLKEKMSFMSLIFFLLKDLCLNSLNIS